MATNNAQQINSFLARSILPIFLVLLVAARLCAQSSAPAVSTPTPTPTPTSEQSGSQVDPASLSASRIERARALAAAHQLDAAAAELEAIRKSAQDDVERNVTSVMLMGIYLEEANYVRAKSLLDEDFQARSSKNDAAVRTYFAIAGQALNGARAHLARYRSFGINVSDENLQPEARHDLDLLRSLLERLAAQAREIVSDRKTYDALALLEDVLGIRLLLATSSEDRSQWEADYASAREMLASSETQIASLGGVPSLQASTSRTSTAPSPIKKEPPTSTTEPNPASSSPAVAATVQPDQKKVSSVSVAQVAGPADKPTTKAEEPETINAGQLNTRATKRVLPVYPSIAKTSGTQGVVKVYVTIDETGKVAQISSSEGPILLRQSAELAARGWRFPPTLVDGKAIRLAGYIEFNFTL